MHLVWSSPKQFKCTIMNPDGKKRYKKHPDLDHWVVARVNCHVCVWSLVVLQWTPSQGCPSICYPAPNPEVIIAAWWHHHKYFWHTGWLQSLGAELAGTAPLSDCSNCTSLRAARLPTFFPSKKCEWLGHSKWCTTVVGGCGHSECL